MADAQVEANSDGVTRHDVTAEPATNSKIPHIAPKRDNLGLVVACTKMPGKLQPDAQLNSCVFDCFKRVCRVLDTGKL